jgi:hypothetical protein
MHDATFKMNRYLTDSATPSLTCPYQTAVCHYVWTVITGEHPASAPQHKS